MLPLISLLACSALPDSIPKEPGTVQGEDDLRRLWAAASPDTLFRLFHVLAGLEVYTDQSCPVEESTLDGSLFTGDCTDKYGGQWVGDATLTEHLMNEMRLESFGVDVPVTYVEMYGEETQSVRWTLDGTFQWARVDNTADQRLQIEAVLDYSDDQGSFEAWLDLEAFMAWTPDRIYDVTGEVGLEDWGLAEVALDDTEPGISSDPPCPYPTGGTLTLTGTNVAEIAFGAADPFCGACPTWSTPDGSGELCEPLPYIAIPYPTDEEEGDTGTP